MHPCAEDALQLNGPSIAPGLLPDTPPTVLQWLWLRVVKTIIKHRRTACYSDQHAPLSAAPVYHTRPHHIHHIILFEQPAQKLFRFLFLPHAFCMPPSGLSRRLSLPHVFFPHLYCPQSVRLSVYLLCVSSSVCLSHLFPFPQFTVFAFIFDNFPRWICIFLCFLSAQEVGRRKADFVAYLMSPPSCAFSSNGDKLTPWNSGNHLQVVNTFVRRYFSTLDWRLNNGL